MGASLAGAMGVADNQGLAGGAIIFFYGLISALVALVVSIILVSRIDRAIIIRINQILFLLGLLVYALVTWRFIENKKSKSQDKTTLPLSERPTTKAVDIVTDST